MTKTVNSLDLHALAKANESERAKLISTYHNDGSAALSMYDYFVALVNSETSERGLSATDVVRKEFLSNY